MFILGCSHCHDLAPFWKQLGTALQGMVGIGAVNCREQWGICQSMRIMNYPTLLWFTEPGLLMWLSNQYMV